MWSKMHQHGPLYNYGPYYGYPPFCPYGPWNAYLQYNGAGYGGYGGGGHGHDFYAKHGDFTGHGGLCTGGKHAGGGHGHGVHGSWSEGGWFNGQDSGCPSCGDGKHGHHGSGCGGCKADAFDPRTTDPVTRYAGAGRPADSAVFYTGLPTITPAGGVAK
jgi:hypothetical protein